MTAESPSDLARLESAVARAGRIYRAFREQLDSRPVAPQCSRDVLRRAFDGTITDEGVGLDACLDDFERWVLPYAMSTPHPRYAGLVNSSPLDAAPLGDLLVSMLNNNSGAYHQSPPATLAEEQVIRAFAELLCYRGASGLVVPGGTYANLHGLLLARRARFPEWHRDGPTAIESPPTLYTSVAAHFSIARTAQMIGLGQERVVGLPTAGRGSLDVAVLRERVGSDRAAGATPLAVVATLGTTGTGAIDDVAAIAEVCAEHGLWLHVDACYGGGAALLEECRPWFEGVAAADSVAVDPHKWFFMPIVAGIALTRHPSIESDTFGVDAPYIPADDEIDAFRRGLATSRRGSGLAVWLTLRAHGWNPIRAAVRRNIEQVRQLEALLAAAGFDVLPDGQLSIACARYVRTGSADTELDEMQRRIAEAVVHSGEAWFSTTRHAGRTWLRFNVVNLHTRDEDVQRIAETVISTARAL